MEKRSIPAFPRGISMKWNEIHWASFSTPLRVAFCKTKGIAHKIYKYYISINSHENIYVNIVKVKLVTLVEGNQKVPFSIATTSRCRGGCYSFPWIAPLYHWSLPYKQGGIKNHFLSHMTWPGIEPWSPRKLANTLPTRPMSRLKYTEYYWYIL